MQELISKPSPALAAVAGLFVMQTMVAGGVVSIAMFAWVAVSTYPSAAALVPFAALTTAVLTHMPFSVGFHLFRGIDAEVYNLWRR